ncbi:MAG: hypothetical protein M1814_000791 [Vezdaea aestivalis]|nr:MAG: hypothetical protein M1814_000791 [Vezdaea aestivalis]
MWIRYNLRPTGLLIALLVTTLYTLPSQAQSALPTLAASATNNNALPGTDRPSASSSASDSSSNTPSASSASATPNSSSQSNSRSSSAAPSASASASASASTSASSSGSSSGSPPPALTTSTPSSEAPGSLPTGLPKLSGQVSYPPASVPPTANAPYMQQSNVPEGTVFIAVGACLGAIGVAILAWRGYIAWSLHRSVKRAALHQTLTEKSYRPPPGATGNAGQFYSAQAGSTLSIDALTSGKRSSTVHQKSHTPNGSLFFSPTANVGAQGSQSNRGSAYLPSGYYPSGSAAPGDNRSSVMLGRGPAAQGYIRHSSGPGVAPSPPGSPGFSPNGAAAFAHGNVQHHASQSSLNVAPQGRAPSAYLEDLFSGRDGRK